MMIRYTKGNILDSSTDALVNTVNCEGFMGKGIAYQFKIKYPENNIEYVNRCKKNAFNIGDILLFEENNKIILNFPTKDNWRKKSKYEFIEKGLVTLKNVILDSEIESVSIPPLGCGNGGLEWVKVKNLIEQYLKDISNKIKIVVFEPIYNQSFKNTVKSAPKLSSSHLLLMKFKMNLIKFNKTRLQKSVYINNVISNQKYFKFKGQNFGPYAHSIDILSRDISEYQKHYGISTKEAFEQGMKVLITKDLNSKLNSFNHSLNKTINIVNSIKNDSRLELMTTILFLVENDSDITDDKIIKEIQNWNEHKQKSFNREMILDEIDSLLRMGMLRKTLYNTFEINRKNQNKAYK